MANPCVAVPAVGSKLSHSSRGCAQAAASTCQGPGRNTGSAPARFKPSSPTSNIKVGSVVTQSRRMSPTLHVGLRRLLAGSPEQSVPHLVGRPEQLRRTHHVEGAWPRQCDLHRL